MLVGYVGEDGKARELEALLRKLAIKSHLIPTAQATSTKVRAIARGQQLLRLDYEEDRRPSKRFQELLLNQVRKLMGRVDAVLVSDYGKGVVTEDVLATLTECKKPCPVITVDPTPAHIDFYRNVTLVTPNTKEASTSVHHPIEDEDDLREVGQGLSERLNANVLITRGENGMSCFLRGGGGFDLPTVAKEVIDVTGAGDTVIAAVTVALAAKIAMRDAVRLANIAAGLVVSKVGTATVNQDELTRALLTLR
jgi:D-beta-D-heptose 7-phosphate kinase/D-beta-D-heptose 1-phosphate adenosyltransferase